MFILILDRGKQSVPNRGKQRVPIRGKQRMPVEDNTGTGDYMSHDNLHG